MGNRKYRNFYSIEKRVYENHYSLYKRSDDPNIRTALQKYNEDQINLNALCEDIYGDG